MQTLKSARAPRGAPVASALDYVREIAASIAQIDTERECALAARDEAAVAARAAGMSVVEISSAAGVTPPVIHRVLAADAEIRTTPSGMEPALDPAWDEVYVTDAEGDIHDRWYHREELIEDLAYEYGTSEETVRGIADDAVDPRAESLTGDEMAHLRHAVWEAARDPHAGRVELRSLRAHRFRHGLDSTPPAPMIVAALKAGARREDVVHAAGMSWEELTALLDAASWVGARAVDAPTLAGMRDQHLVTFVLDYLDTSPGVATAAELTHAAGRAWEEDVPGVLDELVTAGVVVVDYDGLFRLPGGPSRDALGRPRRRPR